jgi:hypothetical protein
MIKAKRLSSQVSLIGHNDIVEMLHGPIYIQKKKKKKKKTLIINQIEPRIAWKIGISKMGNQPPEKIYIHRLEE